MKKTIAVAALTLACLVPLALQESGTPLALGEGEAPAVIELNPVAQPEASPEPAADLDFSMEADTSADVEPSPSPEVAESDSDAPYEDIASPTPLELEPEDVTEAESVPEEAAAEVVSDTETETESFAVEFASPEATAETAEVTPAPAADSASAVDLAPAAGSRTESEWQIELEKALAELDASNKKIDELELQIESLTAEVAIGKAALAQSGSKNVALEGDIKRLEDEIAALKSQRSGLTGAKAVDAWDFDRSAFSRSLLSGFAGAKPATGKWNVSGGRAAQTNGREYFAKLRLPVQQGRKRTLYSFTAKGGPKGWTGVGLHFFISGKTVRYSYGEGKSLLLWFTRDPASYRDKSTYLQLYRSDGLVQMEQVFSGELSNDMAKPFKVEILYDPAREYVLVAVDGSVRVVYKTFFGIDDGVGVALRTLGPGCEFSDFSVRVEP